MGTVAATAATNASPRSWSEVVLGMIYPEICQFCFEKPATHRQGFVCESCWMGVRFIRAPFCERCGLPYEGEITTAFECGNCNGVELHFTQARSAVVSKGVVREAIHKFKYNHALWVEPFLSDLFVREAVPVLKLGKWDFLIPVPLHSARLREREYNQAERLARTLSVVSGIPLNEKLLLRVKSTETQTHLTREHRSENMKHAFAIAKDATLEGLRLVVVDDVFTTGATTNQCAAVLRKAGADEVCVWTLARGV